MKTLKKVFALFIALTCLFTNTVVYAMNETKVMTNDETKENILKVNIDKDGDLTYIEPAGIYEEANENSPFTWDNALVYFVLTDRFVNGDTSNDHSYGRGLTESGSPQEGLEGSKNTSNPGTFHGGDLKGLTEKVEEIGRAHV